MIDRLTVENAKMIAGTGVQRIRPKDTDNSFNTGFSIYDGSSGFKFWTNREKCKELKAALGTQSKSLKVGLEVVRLHLKLNGRHLLKPEIGLRMWLHGTLKVVIR